MTATNTTIPRHSFAPKWSAYADVVDCEACVHLRALRVDRSFTQYQCGCPQCKGYLDWTHRWESKSTCPCFARCTREQFEHMADIWSASAEALRLYYVWLRDYGMNEGKPAEECGVILADIGWVDAHQVLHCAPFLVKDISAENPKVAVKSSHNRPYDNEGKKDTRRWIPTRS